MNIVAEIILIAIIIVIIITIANYLYREYFATEHFESLVSEAFENTKKRKSSVDGRMYNVVENYIKNDLDTDCRAKESAKILSLIHYQNLKLINHLKQKYPDTKLTKNLVKRYKVKNIREVDPFNKKKNTSYTVNKGEELGICIRQKTNENELVDFNDIMYVVIHELAHIGSTSYGWGNHHNAEFRRHFKILLQEANELKIYDPIVDYYKNPRPYCGIVLNDQNPLIY